MQPEVQNRRLGHPPEGLYTRSSNEGSATRPSGQGEGDRDFRAVGTGLNIEVASQVADSFAHSRDADTGTLIANRGESCFGYARAVILNLQRDGGDFASQADHRRLGVGMAMNIGQTFLDDAKEGHFHIAGQSSKVVGNVQVDFQSAALRQSGHEPADGFGQTAFVEQRRMQKVRDGANLFAQLTNQLVALLSGFTGFRLHCILGDAGKIHSQRGDDLSDAVVKVTSDAPAFLVLG